MDRGSQLWFDFAWSMRWAQAVDAGPFLGPGTLENFFSQKLGRAAGSGIGHAESLRPVGLVQVISVDRAGVITRHWQVRHLTEAVSLGRHLAGRLPDQAIKLRRTVELVRVLELDEEIPAQNV